MERDQPEESDELREPVVPEGPGVRRIVAVGGGKGGVGKSLLAANLAIYLAQVGKRVVLIDADLGGANLHTFVGVDRPGVTLADFFDKRVQRIQDCIVETAVPNLGLVSGEGDPLWAANPRPATKNRLINQVRELDVDWLICDLPTGSGFIALDFFLVSHVGLLVINPEPTSVENTFRFIKSAFLRRLRDVRQLEGLATDRAFEGGIPSPLDLLEAARLGNDAEVQARILEEMQRFRPRLLVNQVRSRGDLELGAELCSTGRRRLGLGLEDFGAIEADDAVWQAVRHKRPLLVEHPESLVAKSIEKVARRLLNSDHERPSQPAAVPRPTERQTLYEVLELQQGASDEEIRRAHRRAKEIYAYDSMAVCGLYTPERLAVVQQRIEEAHDTLLDPDKRRLLDLKLFPDGHQTRPGSASSAPQANPRESAAGRAARREEPAPRPPTAPRPDVAAPDLTPETEFSGPLLKQVRESRGIDLLEISQRARVGLNHLRNIEEENWKALPAAVYLRGFVVEYARFLKLNIEQVTRTFMARALKARDPH